MNDFKVVDLLYKGDVSDIWQGIHVASNTEVHVVTVNKKVNGHIFDQKRMVDLEPLVSQLTHPHMLKYHKIVQNENTIGIIMEHPKGGCLRDFLLRRPDKKLSENEARGFFKQIVSAVEYINQFDVVYRNLNLRNIFIDKNNQIKIGDFLICTKVGPIYKPSSATSSYHFYAPEIWLEDGKKIDAAADVWSLGVLLYVMTCGCYPFDGKHEFDIFLSVKRGQFAIPSSLSDECASLIKIILHPEASKRPTIAQLKSHPWFLGVTIPTGPPKRIPSTSALRGGGLGGLGGGLGGIPECEEDQPNSPAMPLLTPFQNLKIEPTSPMHSNTTRSPQTQTQQGMGFSESFGDPFMSYQTPVEAPRRRAKRPSADEDVQKVIASYFQLKQEDNKQSVSNLMANAFPLGHSNSFGNSFDVAPVNPTKMRRSSDSVLHNEEVMRLLGIGEQVNPFAPGSNEAIPQQSGRPGRSNSSGGNGDRKKVIAASPSVKRPSSSSSRPKRRNSMDFSNRSSAHSIQDFSNIILPQAPSDRNDGHSSNSINNQLQRSHFEHMQNFDNQIMSQYQQQQAQQARDMEYQKETQALLSGLPSSSNDRNSVSLQDHPFLDPEVERAIGNLHADMDSLEFSLLDAGSNSHLEEWINSVAKFQGAD